MQSGHVSEIKRVLACSLLKSIHLLLGAAILAFTCGGYAQTSAQSTAATQSGNSSVQPIHIVPFREPGSRSAAGTQPVAGSHVTYFGGPVISNLHVVEVLYGASAGYLPGVGSINPPSVASFSTGLAASPVFDMLNEYSTAGVTPADGKPGTSQTIGHGFFDGLFTITPSAANNGSSITDAQIQNELTAQVNAGNLPGPLFDAIGNSNTVYVIFFPPGTTIHLGTLASCVKSGFCGYHNSTAGLGGKDLLYSVLPDMQPPSGCAVGCGGSGQLDSVTNVLTHELAEAVTDPDVGAANVIGRPLAWVQASDGQEVGDLCADEQGTVFFNSQSYTIQKIFSNFQGDCEAGPPTFNIQGGQTVTPGQKFDLPVTAQTDSGGTIANYTGTVHFTSTDPAASLPADYTFTTADAGFHTFVVSLSTPTTPSGFQTITATDTALPLFTGAANYTVPKSAVSHFSVAMPGTAVQGTPISVIVAARDSSGSLVTNYTGTVHFTTGDSAAVLPADSPLTNGTGTFSVTFNTVNFESLVVADTVDGTIFGEGGSNVIAAPSTPTSTMLTAIPGTSTFGQTVTYKASVTQSGGPPSTGQVNFSSDGLLLGIIPVDANGNAQTTATLDGGQHVIFADYNGGGSAHPPSSSAPLSVQVNAAPTTVTVSSVPGSPSTLGSKIFLNATLSSQVFTPRGGFVTFMDGASPLAVISPITGVASFGDTSLPLGSHTITATYSGSADFAGSTSTAFVQVVTTPPPADYTIQADKNSATLAAGQSATFVITTTSINGFNGNIAFGCDNLPQLTTCAFIPPTTSVGPSGTTATTTLTVKTTGTNALLLAPEGHLSGDHRVYARFWSLSPIAFGILLLAGARRKRRSQAVVGCLLTLLLVTALTSCGGGGTPPPPPPPARTPAGTTSMVVTASGAASGGSSQPANPNQTLNISITVQ